MTLEIRPETQSDGIRCQKPSRYVNFRFVNYSDFNHYCVGCDVTQLNVLYNVHKHMSFAIFPCDID